MTNASCRKSETCINEGMKIIKYFEKTGGKIWSVTKLIVTLHRKTKQGAIAQLVEQRTENPCVPGSIPGGTTNPNFRRR